MSVKFTRRAALSSLGFWAAGSPLLNAQGGEPAGRIAPRAQLLNTLEFEAMAERKLGSAAYSAIAGGDRRAFERMIFRPRMMVVTENMDLSLDLFGDKMFAPILVGPASDQQRFHPEAEVATVNGAAAAKAGVIVSDRSSQPLEKIAANSKTVLWYQIYPQPDMAPVLNRVQQAVKAGCKAVCLTVGTPYTPFSVDVAPTPSKLAVMANPQMNWATVDQIRRTAKVPVLLKGIMSAEEARAGLEKGVEGIIVSNHGGMFVHGMASPMEVLASVVDAVGGKIPVLVDGGFRRGSDVVKALALGAKAVLVTRPPLWGLAAYGAEGVQGVVELLQTETARSMAGCGMPNLAAINRNLVRIVKR